jgi:hypothetical protein
MKTAWIGLAVCVWGAVASSGGLAWWMGFCRGPAQGR